MAVNLLVSLQHITRQIPDLVTVTFAARDASNVDSYGAGVSFEARRQPMTSGDFGGLAKRWARWQLYATASQTTLPTRYGLITESDGTRWHIAQCTRRFGNLVHDCDCVEEI